jgi:hypothetical protein
MWKGEIGRILVPGQPQQKQFARPYLDGKKPEIVVCACHPSNGKKHKIGGLWSRLA